ncbi:MAG TPA: flagellar biosynthetic protein FliR [Steroidobacteraceae bacterium]|nr:flagellar biosynthetic protein FliR [Steroidobacteraceae bacterium]
MTVSMNLAWLTTVILMSVRVAAATAMAAVFGPSQIPGPVRVVIALLLGALIVSVTGVSPVAVDSLDQLLAASIGEVVIGAALAGGFLIALAATDIAGRVLDTQAGFGIAAIFNPTTGSIASLLGTLLGMTALCLFLGMNGHYVLIRALADSARTFPPGTALMSMDWQAAIEQGAVMFAYGLALAAPVMGALLLADVAMGVMARSLPQLNVFVMGFPLKIMMGLAGLAISVRLSGVIFKALFDSTFHYWAHVATGQ